MPQKFLSVKNFDKYQHYKHRNPPWIKLYKAIFTDREFITLSISSRYLLLGLFSLASEFSNRVPNDSQFISHRLAIKVSELDLKPLYRSGFLLASESTKYREMLSQSTETETETEGEKRVKLESFEPYRKGKRAISEEDKPTDKHLTLGQQIGVNVPAEWAKFKNYCLAHDKRYANFEAAFRNWIVNSENMKGGVHVVR